MPATPAIAAGPACGTVVVPPGLALGTPPNSVDSLNPFLISSAYDQEASEILYKSLIWVTRRHTISWPRSLAKSVAVSDNDTVFTVTMRPWTWSDGVPVTSKDAAFTFNLIKRLGKTYTGYGAGGIPMIVKSFQILGPERFRVVLTHSVNPQWFELTGLPQLQPYPAHAWAKYSINQMWRLQSSPSFFKVVDGPYRIQKFVMGRYISFVPNPTYQGHKSEIARFVMSFLQGDGAVIEGLRKGTLDAGNLPFSLWKVGRRLNGIRRLRLPPNFGFDFIQLNFKNPKVAFFRNVKVRDAIADAINRKARIRLLLHGTSIPQYGPVPQVPPTFLSPSAKAGKFPVGYDPAKARQLLDEAGWKPGPNGIREKNGRKLEFNYLTPSQNVTGILGAQLTQSDLRKVGILMTIHEVTFNQMLAKQHKPLAWEAMAFGWSFGAYPDDAVQLQTGGIENESGYSNKKMDRLLAAITTKPGMKALYTYQNYASAQQPLIFEAPPGVIVLARKGLRGLRKAFSPIGAWSPQYLHWTTPPCGKAQG